MKSVILTCSACFNPSNVVVVWDDNNVGSYQIWNAPTSIIDILRERGRCGDLLCEHCFTPLQLDKDNKIVPYVADFQVGRYYKHLGNDHYIHTLMHADVAIWGNAIIVERYYEWGKGPVLGCVNSDSDSAYMYTEINKDEWLTHIAGRGRCYGS